MEQKNVHKQIDEPEALANLPPRHESGWELVRG